MKKLILTLALLGAFLIPGMAGAQSPYGYGSGIESRMFDQTTRTQQFEIVDYFLPTTATGSVTKAITQVGTRGLIMTSGATSMSGSTRLTQTSSIGAMPYPANIRIAIFDSGGGSTCTCSQAAVSGYDWRGAPITEVIPSIVEGGTSSFGVTSTTTFQRVTSVSITGCNGFGASDQIQMYVGPKPGLPSRIQRNSDIISICFRPTGTVAAHTHCGAPTAYTGMTGLTTALVVARKSPSANGINLQYAPTPQWSPQDRANVWITYTGSSK